MQLVLLDVKMAPDKRLAYDADFKLQAIAHAVKHGNKDAGRKFDVNESMVRKWRKQEHDLRQAKKTTKSLRRSKARWPQLEDEMEHWVTEQNAAGRKISALDIRKKAATLARSMNIDEFKGASTWCVRFMKRHNICARTRTIVSKGSPKNLKAKLTTSSKRRKNKFPPRTIQPEDFGDTIPPTCDVPEDVTVEEAGPQTDSNLAITLSESTNELQPPDLKMVTVKRRAYNAVYKLRAIAHAVKHGNRDAGRKFKVTESVVRGWRKQENKLRQAKKTTKSFRGRKAKWPELEDKIEQWVVEQNAANRKISALDIRKKAATLARIMNIEEFTGCSAWCVRFMKRRNICTRTRTIISNQSPKQLKAKLTTPSRRRKTKFSRNMIEPEHADDTILSTVDVPDPDDQTVEETEPQTDSELATTSSESTNKVPDLKIAPTKKRAYDTDFKLQAVAHAVKHGNRDTARKLKVSESVIRAWRKKENNLPQSKKVTRSFRENKARWPQLEDKIEHWVVEQHAAGRTTVSEQSPKILKVKLGTSSRRRKNEFPQKTIRPRKIDNTIPTTVDVPVPEDLTVEEPEPQTNSELAIISNESTNELQPPDVDIDEVKVELRTALEYWMTKCEESLVSSEGEQQVTYSTICQWIVEAWAKLLPSTVVQAFTKAGIITKLQCNNEDTELKNEERNLRVLDAIVTQLLNSDAKQEESEGVL